MHPDSEIHQAVLHELQRDERIDETDVGVEVDAGVVTLTGTVDSHLKRLAAQQAAHRVAGVLDVANDVQVRVPGGLRRTDTEIAHLVRTALAGHPEIPHQRIRTTVSRGRVTLEGEVNQWRESEVAERLVQRLSGVTAVVNLLAIRPPSLQVVALPPTNGRPPAPTTGSPSEA